MAEGRKGIINLIKEKNELLQDLTDKAFGAIAHGIEKVCYGTADAVKKSVRHTVDSFSIEKNGRTARAACKLQEISDEWIDITFDQLAADIKFFRRAAKRALIHFYRWVSVSRPNGLSKVMGKIVSRHDFYQEVIFDNISFQFSRLRKMIRKQGRLAWDGRMTALKYSTVAVIILICMISVFNYATGYEYSYNGRTLGLVKNQEDVAKVVEIASKGLTKEYGVDVQIDINKDFSFRRVVTVDRTTDTPDQVLAKLTYMQDARASAYGIYVGDKRIAVVDSKDTAKKILADIQERYLKKDITYQSVGFAEKVKIKSATSTVGKLMNYDVAFESILSGKGSQTYEVKQGDTIKSIRKKFKMSNSYFHALNPLVTEEPEEGDILLVSDKKPLVTVETKHVKVYEDDLKFKTKKVETDELYEGDEEVFQEGQPGKVQITAEITSRNGVASKKTILAKETVEEPVTEIIYVGTKERPSYIGDGNLINPCPAGYRSSGFGARWGRLHRGMDLACGVGNPIYAADGGIVITATYNYSYGNYVKISHQNGMITVYAHCSELLVNVGDKVAKGQQIAKVGNTGNSTGAHCHFEVEVNGVLQNPANYI